MQIQAQATDRVTKPENGGVVVGVGYHFPHFVLFSSWTALYNKLLRNSF